MKEGDLNKTFDGHSYRPSLECDYKVDMCDGKAVISLAWFYFIYIASLQTSQTS